MGEKTVYECETCKKLKNHIFVFEGTIVKKVLNAPLFPAVTLNTSICSMECLMKKVNKQFGSHFEEKPIKKVVNKIPVLSSEKVVP